ncbi:hypothetical protein C5167_001906 [Papaver somniferum]|uniref:Uncharacterized protein n=1 Tax=Papaver somniferum TaxID=3469 RepID=A0A4Y7L0L6_PAPSO|nr:hypothetical protein C5167_001906 [Papaver somniferum]
MPYMLKILGDKWLETFSRSISKAIIFRVLIRFGSFKQYYLLAGFDSHASHRVRTRFLSIDYTVVHLRHGPTVTNPSCCVMCDTICKLKGSRASRIQYLSAEVTEFVVVVVQQVSKGRPSCAFPYLTVKVKS